MDSAEHLAAFHKKHGLHEGHERGIGSRHHRLHPAHKAHLDAIEHLISVEAHHVKAEAALADVHAKVERAMQQVEATEMVSHEQHAKDHPVEAKE